MLCLPCLVSLVDHDFLGSVIKPPDYSPLHVHGCGVEKLSVCVGFLYRVMSSDASLFSPQLGVKEGRNHLSPSRP